MALWTADVSTPDGAEGAAGLAGYACFILAGLGTLGLLFLMGVLGSVRTGLAGPMLIGASIEILLFLAAGFRFRAGKGLVLGIVVALVLVLEIVGKLLMLTGWGGILIDAICLVVIVNGLRGVRALRKGFADPEETAEIFS